MMTNINTEPAKVVTFVRDGLIEQEHFGYVVRANKTRVIEKIGEDKNKPVKNARKVFFKLLVRLLFCCFLIKRVSSKDFCKLLSCRIHILLVWSCECHCFTGFWMSECNLISMKGKSVK